MLPPVHIQRVRSIADIKAVEAGGERRHDRWRRVICRSHPPKQPFQPQSWVWHRKPPPPRPGMKIDAAPIASAEAPPKYNARDLPVIVPLPTTFTRISKLRMTRGLSAIPPLQSPGKANELGVNLKIPSRDCGGYSSRRRPVCEVKRIQNAPACCFLNGQDFPEKDNSLKIQQKSMRPDLEPKNSWHCVGAIRRCCIKITREVV